MSRYRPGPQVAGRVYRGGVTASWLRDEDDRAWLGDWEDGVVFGADVAAAGGGQTRIEIFLTLEDVRQVLLMSADSRGLAMEQIDHIRRAAHAIVNRESLVELSETGLHAVEDNKSN